MSMATAGGHHSGSGQALPVAELLRKDGDGPPSPFRRQPGHSANALPVAHLLRRESGESRSAPPTSGRHARPASATHSPRGLGVVVAATTAVSVTMIASSAQLATDGPSGSRTADGAVATSATTTAATSPHAERGRQGSAGVETGSARLGMSSPAAPQPTNDATGASRRGLLSLAAPRPMSDPPSEDPSPSEPGDEGAR